jgi:hypothetical protein
VQRQEKEGRPARFGSPLFVLLSRPLLADFSREPGWFLKMDGHSSLLEYRGIRRKKIEWETRT